MSTLSQQHPTEVATRPADRPTPPWSFAGWKAQDPTTVAATDAELRRRGFVRRASRTHPGERGLARVAAIRRWQLSIGTAPELTDGVFGPRQWAQFWHPADFGRAASLVSAARVR